MATAPNIGFRGTMLPHEGAGDHEVRHYPEGVPRHLHYPKMPTWGLLDRACNFVPQRTAIEFLGRRWSYAQIRKASWNLAAWLQQHQVGAGSRVGVLLPNCPEYAIAVHGIWRAGGVVVALSPLSVAEEVERLVAHTQCETVICLDMLAPLLAPVFNDLRHLVWVTLSDHLSPLKAAAYRAIRAQRTGRMWWRCQAKETWLTSILSGNGQHPHPVEVIPDRSPAFLLGTSGTTGTSRVVTLSHANLVSNAWQQLFWAGATMGDETLMAVLPFFHSYGMSAILNTGFALGATLVVLPRFAPPQVVRTMHRHQPTVLHAVPAMLDAMNYVLRKRSGDFSRLKWVVSGGASLPVEVGAEFADRTGAIVVEGYGLSEASPVTHVGPLDGSSHLGTIGLPLPDTQACIVDASTGTQAVPDGEVGELIVRGPQVMLGYWDNPQGTGEVLRNGWLYTGDLAYRSDDGYFHIVDRKKDLIISNGFNVYPSDVEEVLRRHEGVDEVAVIGIPDKRRGEIVKAFVRLKPRQAVSVEELERYCREHMAAHLRPRLWEIVEGEMPRNFLGKVLRRQLRETSPAAAPQSEDVGELPPELLVEEAES
ncbi:MAG: long-chain-fatty-acid--CoA ligase [Pirellulaceae bacterium]|nr:MAG: long-chain-fatty-acid--CoA ligase [Pirellulaceae bacterium]